VHSDGKWVYVKPLSNRPGRERCRDVGTRSFRHRRETFGYDIDKPWAADVFRLLFNTPRAYQPLVDAWDTRNPGTRRALDRLAELGFVVHQPGVVIDTRTGELADRLGIPVRRFRTTSAGRRLITDMREDLRVIEDRFPRMKHRNTKGVARLLQAFDLEGSHAKYGMSCVHATEQCGMSDRSARWWVRQLHEKGYLRELDERYADVREVVPGHYRVTRALRNQLRDVLDTYRPDLARAVSADLRLGRRRFLGEVDPSRVGVSGATDFDHDVECQRVLAALVRSPRFITDGVFTIEPKFNLTVDMSGYPWRFDSAGDGGMFYQPDAEIRERDPQTGKAIRSVVEYERYQTRRDGWNHIERFIGYLHLATLPFEPAVLRFVVDSNARVRAYVKLIEAFADYAMDNPAQMPGNKITLAVSSVPRVQAARDPLDPAAWHRIDLPSRQPADGSDTDTRPSVHKADDSPYDDYFARNLGREP
jgi:hypothetical protein